jgi:CRP-like cAMP-binding protein/membrane protease YdiL (CAAX protease family)
MDTKDIIIAFLSAHSIAKDFSSEELDCLYQLNKILTLDANTPVFNEGDLTRDVYFIFEGEVEILKWNKEENQKLAIGKVLKSGMFGEMSFLDGEPRSSSVKTTQPSIIIQLSYEMVSQKLDNPLISNIYNKILQNIATTNIKRLRVSNQNYVQSLQTEIDLLNSKNSFGILFISIIFLMGFVNIADTLFLQYGVNTHTPLFSWSFLIALLIPSLIVVKKINCSLGELGVTLVNWKRSVIEAIIISAIVECFVMLAYWIYTLKNPTAPSLSYVIMNPLKPFDFFVLIYIVHSYIQEFIARGIIQSSLIKFMGTSTNSSRMVILTAFLFGFFHSSWGIEAVFVTFAMSLVFGFIYIRTNNLLGVSIAHYVAGVTGIHYMGLIS